MVKNVEKTTCEVLIVGGGPAGISCALSIARGGGSLVLCDDKNPRNKNSKLIRNIPGYEGIEPKTYLEFLSQGIEKYQKVILKEVRVVDIQKTTTPLLVFFLTMKLLKV